MFHVDVPLFELEVTFVPALSVLQWLTGAYVCAKVSEY